MNRLSRATLLSITLLSTTALTEASHAAGFPPVIRLVSLSAGAGFRLDGATADDFSGWSVAKAGDVNGDGIGDVIIGANYADPAGRLAAGSSYVVFGKSTDFTSPIALSALNGTTGFRIDGRTAADRSGWSVSGAGDINGDGFDDVIVGAYGADPGGRSRAGSSYVIFGKASGFAPSIAVSSLNGHNGFRIDGVATEDLSGQSVAAAGDVNGDGFGDLIIGASGADPGGITRPGSSYVVLGKAALFPSIFHLSSLNGSNGFRLDGVSAGDYSGLSVAGAGDVNGDGFDDVIVGANGADPLGQSVAGSSYVVFGKASLFPAKISLSTLDGSNGFRLDGTLAGDNSGHAVAAAGDVNNDGFGDLIIGANKAGPTGKPTAGLSYVVFGKASGFNAKFKLSNLNGNNGFRLDGVADLDQSGISVAGGGDVNGDGFDDVIVGAFYADPAAKFGAGSTYVVFGKASGFAPAVKLSSLDGAGGFRIDGAVSGDRSGFSVSGAGDVNGDGIADVILGAYSADSTLASRIGMSYVVFGRTP